ncbi:MAG: thioredoxin family protein [Candidatus Bathyarchaeia archaeon]
MNTRILSLSGASIAVLLICYGILIKGQLDVTRVYSSVICTSCLGIEEIAPELTFREKAELTKVEKPVHVLLFTMKGCIDCYEAHDYIESVCGASSGKVSYSEIDVLENQSMVEYYGIRYVPTVVVGDKKLEGLKAIRDELISTIIEFSRK